MLVLLRSRKSISHKRHKLVYFFVVFSYVSFLSVCAFTEYVALRSVVSRYACCTDSHTQLVHSSVDCFLFCFFSGDVAFSEHHVPLPFLSCRVRGTFSLQMCFFFVFFQPCGTTWILTSAYYLRFESINQSINPSTSFLLRVAT